MDMRVLGLQAVPSIPAFTGDPNGIRAYNGVTGPDTFSLGRPIAYQDAPTGGIGGGLFSPSSPSLEINGDKVIVNGSTILSVQKSNTGKYPVTLTPQPGIFVRQESTQTTFPSVSQSSMDPRIFEDSRPGHQFTIIINDAETAVTFFKDPETDQLKFEILENEEARTKATLTLFGIGVGGIITLFDKNAITTTPVRFFPGSPGWVSSDNPQMTDTYFEQAMGPNTINLYRSIDEVYFYGSSQDPIFVQIPDTNRWEKIRDIHYRLCKGYRLIIGGLEFGVTPKLEFFHTHHIDDMNDTPKAKGNEIKLNGLPIAHVYLGEQGLQLLTMTTPCSANTFSDVSTKQALPVKLGGMEIWAINPRQHPTKISSGEAFSIAKEGTIAVIINDGRATYTQYFGIKYYTKSGLTFVKVPDNQIPQSIKTFFATPNEEGATILGESVYNVANQGSSDDTLAPLPPPPPSSVGPRLIPTTGLAALAAASSTPTPATTAAIQPATRPTGFLAVLERAFDAVFDFIVAMDYRVRRVVFRSKLPDAPPRQDSKIVR